MESIHGDVARGEGVILVGDLRAVITDQMQQPPAIDNENMNSLLRENWSFTKTKLKRGAVINMLNVRLWDDGIGVEGYDEGVWLLLKRVWDELALKIKVNKFWMYS